jgi:hypothetical protein
MVYVSKFRPSFNRDGDFVVLRGFDLGGRRTREGEFVDKSVLTTRTLRQLYDQRRIRFATAEEVAELEALAASYTAGGAYPAGDPPSADFTDPGPELELQKRHEGGGWYVLVRGDRVVSDRMRAPQVARALQAAQEAPAGSSATQVAA